MLAGPSATVQCMHCHTVVPICSCSRVFMLPTFKKLDIILVSLVSASVCVRPCVCTFIRDIILKLHVWIPYGEIADAFFFKLSSLVKLRLFKKIGMKFCKCHISRKVLKLETSADRG